MNFGVTKTILAPNETFCALSLFRCAITRVLRSPEDSRPREAALRVLQTEAQARGYARIAGKAKEAASSKEPTGSLAARASDLRQNSSALRRPTKTGAELGAPLPSV